MADKLEFSEKLVYYYFKKHKLHKSGADAVIQMVQFARSEETEPSEALKDTIPKNISMFLEDYLLNPESSIERTFAKY